MADRILRQPLSLHLGKIKLIRASFKELMKHNIWAIDSLV